MYLPKRCHIGCVETTSRI